MKISAFAMHPKLKADCQICVYRPSDALSRAKRCGAEALEYTCAPLEELDINDLKRGIQDTGVKLSMIGSYYWVTEQHMNFLSPDDRIVQETVDNFKKALKLGAEIDSPVAIGQLRGNLPNDYHSCAYYEDRLVEVLKDIAAYATKLGASFTYEPENRFYLNWLCTSKDGLRIINRVGYDKFLLTLDLKHMNVEEDIIEGLVSCRDVCHNIHFIDADNTMVSPNSILDIPRIIQALCAIRYPGYLVTCTSSIQGGEEQQDRDLCQTIDWLRNMIAEYGG